MELGERELRNFVRAMMPELYQIQASIDEWEEAIAKIVSSSIHHL